MAFHVYQTSKNWFEQNKLPLSADLTATSTNDQAKEEAFALSVPLKVYLCDQQTQGRGRGTNVWLNPESGTALLITFSLDVSSSPQPITAPLIGLKLYQALTEKLGLSGLSLKAPNDILINGKKTAGILVETVKSGNRYRLIVGIGLNVFSHPSLIPDAKELAKVDSADWTVFLEALVASMRTASRQCISTHLCESERLGLLKAINLNPNLINKYDSISPFGDLVGPQGTLSWRDL